VIFTIKAFMSLATLCYAFGYALRHRNNALHRRIMAGGFVLTIAIAVVLVVGVHFFGASYRPAFWLVESLGEARAHTVLLIHRAIATLTFLLLALQAISGARRLPLHSKLYPFTILTWIISYISGMFIFV
jgi:uncharacterized membrane protein YozB (DUF420 family)